MTYLLVPQPCIVVGKQGCLVIFFTNFLALLIKAEVADPDSEGSTAFSVGLIVANISLVILSIWWNTWATIKAMFSQGHFQVRALVGVCFILLMLQSCAD